MSSITVDSAAALNAALTTAHDGDTILLAPGVYSGVQANGLSFATGITITSADLDHRATLTNFDMNNDHGITLSHLEWAAQAPGYFVFQISDSSDIRLDYLNIHGSLDGNPQNDTQGVAITGSTNVSVTNSEFQQLRAALAVNTSTGVTVTGNHIHDVEATGIVMAQVANVQISGNAIHNFFPALGDHPDAIQFQSRDGSVASHDISITNNAIYRGAGDGAQGIFFRDQSLHLPYQNVTIADNLIDGTGYGGIYASGLGSGTISGNQLFTLPGATNSTGLLVEDLSNVTVTNNQAIAIGFNNNTNIAQSDNTTNAMVSDGGTAALRDWLAAHPGAAMGLSSVLSDVFRSVADFLHANGENLTASAGRTEIVAGLGDDTLTGWTLDSYLRGGDGHDVIIGGGGFDDINGNVGNDTAHGNSGDDWVVGGKDNDLLFGDAGNDVVWGNLGADTVDGGDGADQVRGGQGDDSLSGGAGTDYVSGDMGNDTETGGAGADIFHGWQNIGIDRVLDFNQAEGDRVMLDPGTTYSVGQVGADTIIDLGGGNQMILVGVQAATLTGGWIFLG